ncbi:MAG: TerC family protein [Rhizobiales bacterium]|nr:TerC family protein [Hyphomicrobiales bacterium]MBI3674686.1 TerC family protein [Hyphomicrobiales bacterium]
MNFSAEFLLSIVEVAWINILLSGDNAVVIALACRSLPDRLRRWGILLGSAAAIALRIGFAFMVTWLMAVPYLQAAGGVLLLWIAASLTNGEDAAHSVKAHENLWRAVGTIAVADMAMSLDNVVAIAAVARGNHWLFIFGLVLSIPLIVVGASLISGILEKWPVLVWAGAAILGWVAGQMIGDDPALLLRLGLEQSSFVHFGSAALGGAAVLLAGFWLKRRNAVA